MSDILFKFKCLFAGLFFAFDDWKETVWKVQLDDLVCCSGRDCNCQAATVRQQLNWGYFKK